MHTKAVLTLIGGVLIHLTLGTLYTSSNLATYVISYCHVVKGQKVGIFVFCIMNRILTLLCRRGFLLYNPSDKSGCSTYFICRRFACLWVVSCNIFLV